MAVTVVSTNLPYPHYMLYLLPAMGTLAPACFRIFKGSLNPSRPRMARESLGYASVTCLVAGAAVTSYLSVGSFQNPQLQAPFQELFFKGLPLIVLSCLLAGGALIPLSKCRRLLGRRPIAILVWLPFFIAPLILAGLSPSNFRGSLAYSLSLGVNPVDRVIIHYQQPGARLAIWGWSPNFAAESGMPLGTRDSHTQWAIEPNPLLGYFRERYLRDMKTIHPTLFLEAVGPNCFRYTDRNAFGIGCFPELAGYIAANYRLAAEIEGMRLFVSNDILIAP